MNPRILRFISLSLLGLVCLGASGCWRWRHDDEDRYGDHDRGREHHQRYWHDNDWHEGGERD